MIVSNACLDLLSTKNVRNWNARNFFPECRCEHFLLYIFLDYNYFLLAGRPNVFIVREPNV